MKCEKCGNEEQDAFDYRVDGMIGTPDAKMVRVCLECGLATPLTEQDEKDFKERDEP